MTTARRGDPLGRNIPSRLRQSIRRKLLEWYDRHRRDLPWRRRAGDPYAQWVAEIMLQQTRVETVIPYYERFMQRFPAVASLARARHETVLKHWEGLGYYRRILHLHEAVRRLHGQRRGIPESAAALRALPGVGAYTAAAIASIAFQEPVAAVDGNVARVVSRLCGIDDDILTPAGRVQIDSAADQLLARRRSGDFNQAWMDLGSLVCTPKSPKCTICPVRSDCVAANTGRVQVLPVRVGHRRRPREIAFVVAAFLHDGEFLWRKRPHGGLWSGLWELPTMEGNGKCGENPHQVREPLPIVQQVETLANAFDLTFTASPTSAGVVRHQLTHLSASLHVFVVRVNRPRRLVDKRQARWVTWNGPIPFSISTAQRKALQAARRMADSMPASPRKRARLGV